MECIRLQVGDLDFERNRIYVWEGKGGKDRLTLFPQSIQGDLRNMSNNWHKFAQFRL